MRIPYFFNSVFCILLKRREFYILTEVIFCIIVIFTCIVNIKFFRAGETYQNLNMSTFEDYSICEHDIDYNIGPLLSLKLYSLINLLC